MKKRCCSAVLFLAILISPFLVAQAAQTGATATVEQILARVDEALTKVADTEYTGAIKVVQNQKVTKTIEFKVQLKGITMKRVQFTAPGDIRGMQMLTTEDGLMYVYLPSYNRVRRVAAHVANQGFMGTDLTPDDMSAASYSNGWYAKLTGEDKENWYLSLTPKLLKTGYYKIKLTVLKKYGAVSKIEFLDVLGKTVKVQERERWKQFGEGANQVTIPTLFTIDNVKTGSRTIMELLDCKVNTGIPASAFTKRAILRAD